MRRRKIFTGSKSAFVVATAAALLAGCGGTPAVPYPAFVQADELPDVFLANLPGIRAKQFAGHPQARRSSNRLLLPAEWSGTTGAAPSKSLELFVLAGDIKLDGLTLTAGGYAFIPAGWSGASLSTEGGASLLYFLSDANAQNAIQTPLVTSSEIENWVPPGDGSGAQIKELRRDPGSGARTWLLRVTPQASVPWQKRPRVLEGYLLSGRYRESECIGGKPVTAEYEPGGYFFRPAGAIHGGPASRAIETSVWLMRMTGAGEPEVLRDCRTAESIVNRPWRQWPMVDCVLCLRVIPGAGLGKGNPPRTLSDSRQKRSLPSMRRLLMRVRRSIFSSRLRPAFNTG